MKARNIEWDIDMADVYEVLDNMTDTEVAEILHLPVAKYAVMSIDDRHDLANETFRQNTTELYKLFGLPTEVTVPKYLANTADAYYEENIANWLSDEFEFCHHGFELTA